jgi:peptidoglycan LD-endopeptidase CwlK
VPEAVIRSGADRLAGLHPALLAAVARLAQHADLAILSGRRSLEEQRAIYAMGRDGQGRIVGPVATYAKPGQTPHNWGLAVDMVPVPQNTATLRALGAEGEREGLEWGGRWVELFPPAGDVAHFQLPGWQHRIDWEAAP